MKRCEFIKEDGNRCNRPFRTGRKYCSWHRHVPKQNNNTIKNREKNAMMIIVGGIAIGIYGFISIKLNSIISGIILLLIGVGTFILGIRIFNNAKRKELKDNIYKLEKDKILIKEVREEVKQSLSN